MWLYSENCQSIQFFCHLGLLQIWVDTVSYKKIYCCCKHCTRLPTDLQSWCTIWPDFARLVTHPSQRSLTWWHVLDQHLKQSSRHYKEPVVTIYTTKNLVFFFAKILHSPLDECTGIEPWLIVSASCSMVSKSHVDTPSCLTEIKFLQEPCWDAVVSIQAAEFTILMRSDWLPLYFLSGKCLSQNMQQSVQILLLLLKLIFIYTIAKLCFDQMSYGPRFINLELI